MSLKLIICVCDLSLKRNFFQLESDYNQIEMIDLKNKTKPLPSDNKNEEEMRKINENVFKRLRLSIDGISAFYLLREIKLFTQFREALLLKSHSQNLDILWFDLKQPNKDIIDYKWNCMVQRSLWEQIEIEHLMSWLSTLGGGFSALGEQYSKCAETAGKISLRQLNIGLRLGDPFLQARCKLYYSISLTQTGRLRQAKHLIRQQYEFAKQHQEADKRLIKMCKGVWLRLQYEYAVHLEKRKTLETKSI